MLLREINMTSSFSYTDEDFRETVVAFVEGEYSGINIKSNSLTNFRQATRCRIYCDQSDQTAEGGTPRFRADGGESRPAAEDRG